MVNVFLAEGFEEIEALTVVDILRRADITVNTVSIGEICVTGAHGITVTADKKITECEECDMVVLPGGLPGVNNLENSPLLTNILLKQNKAQKYIAAICAAPMILGKLGMLKNKNAVSYPGFEKYFEGGNAKDDNVCVDGHIITSRGMGTALEFAYEIVSILKDRETAQKIKSGIIDNR